MSLKTLNNRADLLRWVQHYPNDDKEKAAEILGYHYHKIIDYKEQSEANIDYSGNSETLQTDEKITESKTSQTAQEYFYLSHVEHYAAEGESALPKVLQGVQPLAAEDLKSLEKGNPILYGPISNEQRLGTVIQKKLRQKTGKHPDIVRLIKQLSERKPLSVIPTKPRTLPSGRVTVLLDLCERLLPFWEDSHQVCELIKQKHGKFGQDIRIISEESPVGHYLNYEDFLAKKRNLQPWQTIPAQSIVFIVSDMGQLSSEDSQIRKHWLALLHRLNKRGIQPIVIAAIAREHQCPLMQSLSYQVLWHKHSFYKPQKLSHAHQEHKDKVARVLAYLSVSPHIETVLLRAIIDAVFHNETSGIEADVYLHPDIQWGYTCVNVRVEQREHYQGLLSQEPAVLQKQVLTLIKQHHIGQFPMVWFESVINIEPWVNFPLEEIESIEKARSYMERLAVTAMGDKQHEGLLNCIGRNLSRVNRQQKQQYHDGYPAVFYALTQQQAIKAGEPIPEEYDAETVQQAIQDSGQHQKYCLIQMGEQLYITDEASIQRLNKPVTQGKVLASFETSYDTVRIDQQVISVRNDQFNHIPNNCFSSEYTGIDTGEEKLTIGKMTKPTWATAISQRQNSFKAETFFAGQYYTFALEYGQNSARGAGFLESWELIEGNDNVGFDECGIYADLILKNITQRFRWIEPTTFLMGAPEKEATREYGWGKETQRQVTLTQGYWLADTAVTQQFWQAIMGDNPSYFTIKRTQLDSTRSHPVEQVSWDDCQQLIKKLKQQLPEMDFRLPTEAEWENACRAGTKSAFYFGDKPNLEKVNYSGLFDEAGYDNKALQRTASVKSYPCNHWGLYEMHGNVWEWCKDNWLDDLGEASTVDPEFTKVGALRVVRGGSLGLYGRSVRSAIRDRHSPDDRLSFIGLRLALGQSSTSLLKQKAISISGWTGSSVKQETVSTEFEIAAETKEPGLFKWLKPFKGKK